jgi:hypothetical protein
VAGPSGEMSQPTQDTALDGNYLTPIQVSVRTGIPKTRLAAWRRDGRGPVFVKRGSRIEYPLWELEVWLESRRREQAAEEVWGSG